MAKQHRNSDIHDAACQFSEGLPFSYAHLAGKCRRKVLLELFGEQTDGITCPEVCCDVCEKQASEYQDRYPELAILIQAIDELGNLGEVKIAEWIRGGQMAWMKTKQGSGDTSAYGKSPPGLSRDWWRTFIRQAAAGGYISRLIRTAAFGQSYGTYASLQVTTKGRTCVENKQAVVLPCIIGDGTLERHSEKRKQRSCDAEDVDLANKRLRLGKGKHMLPILKQMMAEEENWIKLTELDKERYQYPGVHSSPQGNQLYYIPDVTNLPHYSENEPHFLWNDIQLGKTSTSKNKATMTISGKSEEVCYWMSCCKGVKMCAECDHVVPNSYIKNNCRSHPTVKLVEVKNCPVEFVYVFPIDKCDNRRWIGGVIRSKDIPAQCNVHIHPVRPSLSHKLPEKLKKDMAHTLKDNPYLSTQQLATGQGLGYRPASADISASSYSRLDYQRKRTLRDSGISFKGVGVIMEMENIADKSG